MTRLTLICMGFIVSFSMMSIAQEEGTLVLHLDFEEGANAGAMMSDLSGNDHHGSVIGGDVKVTEGVVGKAGVKGHGAVLLVDAKDPGVASAEGHDGAVENAVGSLDLLGDDNGVALVAA